MSTVLPRPEDKADAVRRMFGAIAPRYDLLNHLLSLNIDKYWRRRAVRALLQGRDGSGMYLDACAGTLDLAVTLADARNFTGHVVASDFSLPMLQHGKQKVARRDDVDVTCADALRLPFVDDFFDGAMVAFGIRNVASLDDGLRELRRVVKPGGRVAILEFCTPAWQPFRAGYLFYFRRVLPFIGGLISKHSTAYQYLPESVLQFPEPDALAAVMERAGFTRVRWFRMTGGIVAVHIAE